MLGLVISVALPATAATPQATLSSHWVPGWGYRDELTPASIDNQHFWSDNAGKILTMAELIHDGADASDASQFISTNMNGAGYIPEALINSSVPQWIESSGGSYVTNGIVELHGDNSTNGLEQLEVGNNYTGYLPLAYVGGDRAWADGGPGCCAIRARSSEVFVIPDGFAKRSFFSVNGTQFYVIVNATVAKGLPYANVTAQMDLLESSGPAVSQIFLQLFNTTDSFPFEAGSAYASDGTFLTALPSKGAMPVSGPGLAMAYSNHTSVFTDSSEGVSGQDAVALEYGSQSLYDLEHWVNDPAFSHSWLGLGYDVPSLGPGEKSTAAYSKVYPLEHFDFRMANQTARYIASDPRDVSVVPPVGFGFVAYGLALLAKSNPAFSPTATRYWDHYLAAYTGTDPTTAYARSIETFSLAGFELYGCNSTVESLTREFVGAFPGSSIEEYGWAADALHQLYACTGSPADAALYQSVIDHVVPDPSHFVRVDVPGSPPPTFTFQFGEAASGLMLGGAPYNSSAVVGAMDAVYQSDANGTVYNTPYEGDLANTETLPAYLLSTSLFESAMNRSTGGLWISSLAGCNVTSVSLSDGNLVLSARGSDGTVVLSSLAGDQVISVNGNETFTLATPAGRTTTSTTPNHGEIPEFSYQLLGATMTSLAVAGSYLLAKGWRPVGPRRPRRG